MLSNKAYDVLKWICEIVIPAAITLFITLAKLWNWDIPVEAIVGTVAAVNTFLGVVLKISNSAYKKQL